MNKSMLVLVLIAGASAQAKTYFDPAAKKAIVFFEEGDKVKASVCEDVTEEALKHSLSETLKSCKPLSKEGVSLESLKVTWPKILADVKQNPLSSALANMIGLEAVKPENLFEAMESEARDPSTEAVKKSAELDDYIQQFITLSPK